MVQHPINSILIDHAALPLSTSLRKSRATTQFNCLHLSFSMIPLWTIPLAAATGNTLILKPSERDPGAAMIIAELCERAGLPPGVLNIVHGTVPTVNAICDHPDIKAISFVGGDKAGKHIYNRLGNFPTFGETLMIIVVSQGQTVWKTRPGL
jgi:hypothetical protein